MKAEDLILAVKLPEVIIIFIQMITGFIDQFQPFRVIHLHAPGASYLHELIQVFQAGIQDAAIDLLHIAGVHQL